jgi:hypothetical protein
LFSQHTPFHFPGGHLKPCKWIPNQPAVLYATVYNLSKIADVLHGGVVIAFANTFEPEFVVGQKFEIKRLDFDIVNALLPFDEGPCMAQRSFVALCSSGREFLADQCFHLKVVLFKNLEDFSRVLAVAF